jgi:limonene-1,2-epoxide hydrolase
MNNNKDPENQPRINPLSTDLVLDLWSRTYNTRGKPDWSHIFPYYHDDIIFHDPIQKVVGKQAFIDMCNRLSTRCEQLEMDITSIASTPSVIFLEWKMTMIFRKTPSTAIFGCTKLTLAKDGRIIQQRDYYDLLGDIFPNVPVMRKVYPKIMHRLFG